MSTLLNSPASVGNAHPSREDRPVPPAKLSLHGEWGEPIRYVANAEFEQEGHQEIERAAELLRERRAKASQGKAARRATYRLPATIVQLCESPLLSPDEEVQLFKAMNYLKYQAELLRESLEGEAGEAKAVAQLDQLLAAACEIRNAIVESNTRLVVSVVKGFADEVNPFEDLVSEGITAVIRAAETFDYGRGFRFSTYATRSIRSAIFRKIMQDRKRRERYRGGEVDTLAEPWEENKVEELSPNQYRELRGVVENMLTVLDERERMIIEARYQFVGRGKRPPFRVIAEKLGVSKERVRQLEARALRKLSELGVQIPGELMALCQ